MPSLRAATDADSEGVIALIGRAFAEYEGCVLDVDREEPDLRAPASSFDRFWVVEEKGEILGTGACSIHADRVEVKKIYVDPRLRGRGWGRTLIKRVEQTAREVGRDRVDAWSDTRFTTAHAVYEHLGYVRQPETRDLHDLSRTTEHHFVKTLA